MLHLEAFGWQDSKKNSVLLTPTVISGLQCTGLPDCLDFNLI